MQLLFRIQTNVDRHFILMTRRHLLQPKGRRLWRKKQSFHRFKKWIRCQLARQQNGRRMRMQTSLRSPLRGLHRVSMRNWSRIFLKRKLKND